MSHCIGSASDDGYISPDTRELRESPAANKNLILNPWAIIRIIFELIEQHLLTNDPQQIGYITIPAYDSDPKKSKLYLDISYNWKSEVASKRPAVFISRGPASIQNKTFQQMISANIPDSEHLMTALVEMPVIINCIAQGIPEVEYLADYIKQPIMYFAQQIQDDCGIARIRLTSIGQPQVVEDSKEHFRIQLQVDVAYYDNWMLRGDFLKLRTVDFTVFNDGSKNPLEMQ